jgi:raffinose/stachyose/melibiose transport system substrate-binding protein
MTSFVQSNPALAKKFLPAVLKSGQVDGKTYALPNNNVQPVILYFNKDALAKAGVQAPKTWDELLAVIPRLNAAGVAPLSIGGQSKWPELMWLEYLTDRVGGPEVFNNIIAGKPNAWSDPAVIQALTMIQQLVDAGGFVKGFSSIAADSNADQALLFTGKAAMLLQGGWIYSTLKTNAAAFVSSGKLGYTTFPTVTGGKGDPANVVGNPANFWSISSKATDAQKKTAQSYLADGMFTDAYIDTLIKAGTVPVVQGIESKLEAAGSDKDFLVSEYNMVKNAPGFQLSWDQALSPGTADTMLSNLDQIFLKKISPQQFADTMNATLEK